MKRNKGNICTRVNRDFSRVKKIQQRHRGKKERFRFKEEN